jgi:hypothetical protein
MIGIRQPAPLQWRARCIKATPLAEFSNYCWFSFSRVVCRIWARDVSCLNSWNKACVPLCRSDAMADIKKTRDVSIQ